MRWESYLFFVAYVCNFIFKNSFNLKSKIYFLLKALRYYFMCCSAVQHNLVVLYWRNLCYYIFIVVFYIISWKKATQRSYVFWLLKSMVAGLEIRPGKVLFPLCYLKGVQRNLYSSLPPALDQGPLLFVFPSTDFQWRNTERKSSIWLF